MKIFIFPSAEQENYLQSIKEDFKIISKKEKYDIKKMLHEFIKLYSGNCEIIPCSEEAIYLASSFTGERITFPFSNEYFTNLTKSGASNNWDAHLITHIEKSESLKTFPVIAKPNFGFGSILVKKLNNEIELIDYEKRFFDKIKETDIERCMESYFPSFKNSIVYEKDETNSDFFSVPFVYDKQNKKIYSYPILGLTKFEDLELTDYYWSSFLFNPNQINIEVKRKIDNLLKKVSNVYCNKSMVCMAEVIYDRMQNIVKLLEFSPRTPGGKMSQLVFNSVGVDLEILFIDFALGHYKTIEKRKAHPIYLELSFKKEMKADISSQSYSLVFDKGIYYSFFDINKHSVALVPGGFCPLHKGHEMIINKAIEDNNFVIILVVDRANSFASVEERVGWINLLYPSCLVLPLYNFPRHSTMEMQNQYIKNYLKGISINYVYHSNMGNLSLAQQLNAQNRLVDPQRNKIHISGTEIREDLEENRCYLSEIIYKKVKNKLKFVDKAEKF